MFYNVKKISNDRNRGSMEKWLVLGLGGERHKMSLRTSGKDMVPAPCTGGTEPSEPEYPHTLSHSDFLLGTHPTVTHLYGSQRSTRAIKYGLKLNPLPPHVATE